jgi:N-terminal acetyltransferase B complex non-catalytic subunit
VCEIYEAAIKKDPSNEEFLSHLFMAYVRVGNYKKQQQAALALFKQKPKNPYYFWAVMSIVMQSVGADEKYAKTVCLPLAERMVQKFIKEKKIESDHEVHLYLIILDLEVNLA